MKKKTTKAKVKTAAPQPPIEPRIVKAAMDIAAEDGWAEVTSEAVAKRAKVQLDEVRSICPDKVDLLKLLAEEINIVMLDGGEVDGAVRDNLFELIMRRLEAMQDYRAGILAVKAGLREEPGLIFKMAGTFHETLGNILDMAGVNTSPLHRAGLAALVLAVFHVWSEDESADLAMTMAALDKRLGQLERAAEVLEPLLAHAA